MKDTVTIQTEFSKSWDEMEDFFKDLTSNKGWEYVKPVLKVISHLRHLGYDKVFRAGNSVYVLGLSRSLEYGLRDDQHHVGIRVTFQNTFDVHYVAGEDIITQYDTVDILNDNEFYRLLGELAKQLIN
jgi:hypothetical protein